jgi:hypothetical protein
MNNEKNNKLLDEIRANYARTIEYSFIYVSLMIGYMLFLRISPYAMALPILIVLFMHFYYIRFVPKKEASILNYSPIWSSISLSFFILMFLSDLLVGNEKFTWVIGIFGVMLLCFPLVISVLFTTDWNADNE